MREPRREDDPGEQTRRRFVRRQWARRWLAWRVVLAGVLAVGLVLGGLWLLFFSSALAVQEVRVEGTEVLTVREVRAAADVELGVPLARADLDAVRARVESLPAVREVDVSRAWPDGVLLRVDEREAVAAVEVDGELRGMDAAGVVFRDYATPPARLPRVRLGAGTPADARAEAAKVVAALPGDLAGRVSFVEVATVDRIALQLRDGRRVVWGSAEQSADKARVLAVLLQQPAREYDVTVPGQPTTRG